jgi:sn-glycerol 3-phosphate transport system permease protein
MTRTAQWLYGWLLLLPAALLLALFTHYPALATLWHSFHATPKASRAAPWVGLDNYRQLVDDPIFWKALVNNLWFALGTIPRRSRWRSSWRCGSMAGSPGADSCGSRISRRRSCR